MQVYAQYKARIGEAAKRLSQVEARVAKRIAIRVLQEVVRRYKVIGAAKKTIGEWHTWEGVGKWFEEVKR